MTKKEFIELLKYAGWNKPYTNMQAKIYAWEVKLIFDACEELKNTKKVPVSVIYECLDKILAAAE